MSAASLFLAAARDVSCDAEHPMTSREIIMLTPTGRCEIGQLLHRDYESGYPQRWEVWVHGTGTFDFYPDQAAAEAGARELIAAARVARRGREFWDFHDIVRPWALAHPVCSACHQPLPVVEPAEAAS